MPQNFEHIVRNQSSRFGIRPRLIVLHDTEGANLPGITDLHVLGNFFDQYRTRASAHKGIDAAGNCITMVADYRKAWHAGYVNNWALGIEQVAHASWNTDQWVDKFHLGLYRVAAQLATWHTQWGIPIQVTHSGIGKGITEHRFISGRGGHWDPGYHYPLQYVVDWARLIWHRRQRHPRLSAVAEYNEKVRRVQHKYRPGRINTRPW